MIKILIAGAVFIILGLITLFSVPVSQKSVDVEEAVINEEEFDTDEVKVTEVEEVPVSKADTLNLSGQGLAKAPESIFGQKNLKELNLSNNNLEGALQAEVRYLENLEVLNLSNNQFTGLPAEIGQLSKLRVLDLSNNQLTGLPYELGNLKNLQRFDLRGNDYSKQDLEVIKQGLASDVVILVNGE